MNRRTITLPDDLAARIDAAVAGGAARSVSGFMQDAVRHYLDLLTARRLATEAARLEPAEEVALARGDAPPGPWGRLA